MFDNESESEAGSGAETGAGPEGVSALPDADLLAQLAPGVELAALLRDLQTALGRLDDAAVVEVVAAWRRLVAWAAAGAAHAAAELATRESMNPHWPTTAGPVAQRCVAGDELALRLGISRRAGQRLVRTGQALDGPLWPTADALTTGAIDEAKTTVLVNALHTEPGQVALAVQDLVLPTAPHRTPTQLAADIHRALLTVAPHEADQRATDAVARRRVNRPTVLPDGMAGIWAVLPAPSAMAIWGRLDTTARTAHHHQHTTPTGEHPTGEHRTLDQLRADTLTALLLRQNPPAPATTPAPTTSTTPAHTNGTAGTGTSTSDSSGSLEIEPATQDAQDALEHALGTPARADIHVTVPLDVLLDLNNPTLEDETATDTDTGTGTGTGTGTDHLDLPAPTGRGPAHLHGYGPIAPATAAALAHGATTWQRLVTDPLTGALLDVGTTRYRPPPALDRHIRLRDHTCRRPGCTTPATHTDLDHTTPYNPPHGPTAHHNLGALCRRDHLLKTHAGYHLTQTTPGTFEWTTPTGHHYTQHPHPHDTPPPPTTHPSDTRPGDDPHGDRPPDGDPQDRPPDPGPPPF